MKSSIGCMMGMVKGDNKAYLGVLFIQFVYAGRALFAKLAISQGMSPYVFVFYRQAFASLALAPFAYFFDRKKCDHPSNKLLCKIFFVSLCGITLSLNLDSISMNYASATFTVAISNTVPAITFIMALLLRMEVISIRKRHGIAKLLGTLISLAGASVFVLVKGPPMYSTSKHQLMSAPSTERDYSREDWIKGSLSAISSNVAWSIWIIMQAPIVKEYPALLRLTAIQTFFSCIQSAIWAAVAERNLDSWKLGWDTNLLAVGYCGFIFTGITYWLRIWVIEKKGPVFLAMFTPLALLNTAILSAILWGEVLHWGSVGGGILLVGGLYGFLWGKHDEVKAEKAEDDQKPNTITSNTEQETV